MSSASKRAVRTLLSAALLAGALAGCADADLYFDRRDTIALHAGDAVASNIIVQTIDPWPRVAGDRNIPANGDRMQAAGERYRTGKVTQPQGLGTSSVFPGAGGGAEPAADAK